MPITPIPAAAEGLPTSISQGTATMKNYVDPTNRISIAGTDCMPKAAAMTDGRLGRLFDALNMLECVFGERHLDDEVTEVMHAFYDLSGEQPNPKFAKAALVED